MSEQAPNTAMSALLIVIVVFVVAIVFLTLFTDSGSQIVDIFNEVFYGEQTQKEEAEQNTLQAQAEFLTSIDKCGYDPTINPRSKEECFCYTGTFGEISDESYLSLQNQESKLLVTAYNSNDAPIGQETKAYNLGLFVEKHTDSGRELGCIFPTSFFIVGKDEKNEYGSISNNWYIYWKDDITEKWFFEKGDDYTFGLYRDKETTSNYKYAQDLRAAHILYKVSSSQYCLVTDLLEFPVGNTEGYVYETVSGQDVDTTYLTDFFTEDAIYCNNL